MREPRGRSRHSKQAKVWTIRGSLVDRDKILFFGKPPDRSWGPLRLLWAPGTISMGVKWPGREADLHPVPRLRISRAILLLLLYTLTAYRRATLFLPLNIIINMNMMMIIMVMIMVIIIIIIIIIIIYGAEFFLRS